MKKSNGKPNRRKSRRRGRPPGRPLSRRELDARRRNLERARASPKDLVYRPTAKRLAASLKNLRKAIAARRKREARERLRFNALVHGVYSRELVEESVARLGEDAREFKRHHHVLARLLVPLNEPEATVVWEIANVAWRRLRLFRAQALREMREVRRLAEQFPGPAPLDAAETELRADLLYAALDDCERVVREAGKLRFEMQEMVNLLVANRTEKAVTSDEKETGVRSLGSEVRTRIPDPEL